MYRVQNCSLAAAPDPRRAISGWLAHDLPTPGALALALIERRTPVSMAVLAFGHVAVPVESRYDAAMVPDGTPANWMNGNLQIMQDRRHPRMAPDALLCRIKPPRALGHHFLELPFKAFPDALFPEPKTVARLNDEAAHRSSDLAFLESHTRSAGALSPTIPDSSIRRIADQAGAVRKKLDTTMGFLTQFESRWTDSSNPEESKSVTRGTQLALNAVAAACEPAPDIIDYAGFFTPGRSLAESPATTLLQYLLSNAGDRVTALNRLLTGAALGALA